MEIIEQLKDGKVILYPTDTIWGIGCDATNEEACKRIIELKKRAANKSFIVLVDGFQMLEKYVPEFHEICYDLADLATSPLTIIYPNAKGLAPSVIADDGSVGIRITNDPICIKLIRGMKKPLVSTSANITNQPNPTCFSEIDETLKKNVDATVFERLNETMILPSQIIKIELDGTVKILRK
jgi:L-threonylcarbamoyladenylate synthase